MTSTPDSPPQLPKEVRDFLTLGGVAIQWHLDEDAHSEQAELHLDWMRRTGGYNLETEQEEAIQ